MAKTHYIADFETTTAATSTEETRVWGWATCEVDDVNGDFNNVEFGTDVFGFLDWCAKKPKLIYFHNLKFDGEFIIAALLELGFTWSNAKKLNDWQFSTVINDAGAFYKIVIMFRRQGRKLYSVTIQDSLKKLPFSAERIAHTFDLPILKGSIDYDAPRPVGHELTVEEMEYLNNDVEIISRAIAVQYEQGFDRMTIGSDSMNDFIDGFGGKDLFRMHFPVLPVVVDTDIRQAYSGGWTYLRPERKDKDVGRGRVYDVNSLFPWAMRENPMPWGVPVRFDGEYQPDENYPLYVQSLTCEFSIKPEFLPTVNGRTSFFKGYDDYLTDSGDDHVSLFLTNIDLQLFFDHYDVWNVTYNGGYKFKAHRGFFDEFIDKWMKVKETSTGALRELAKLKLNNLYGKFGTDPKSYYLEPEMGPDGVVEYSRHYEELEPAYIPMAAFITAYAREKTIRTAQSLYPRFIYADTDSVHLEGDEPAAGIDIHPTHLGAWKDEGIFTKARFIRPKRYLEVEENGKMLIRCAGMPDKLKKMVTWENFHPGLVLEGKLQPERVRGGVIFKERAFTLKDT